MLLVKLLPYEDLSNNKGNQMNKLIPSILITCAVLSACQVKYQSSNEAATQPPSIVKQYQPEITGRACVNGLSMIRVKFDTYGSHADGSTWVYEMKPTLMYTAAVHIHC